MFEYGAASSRRQGLGGVGRAERRARRAPGRPLRHRRGRAAGASRSGTRPTSRSSGPAPSDEYLRLYDRGGRRAVKAVDERLLRRRAGDRGGRLGRGLPAPLRGDRRAAGLRRRRTPTATRRSTSRPSLRRHGCDDGAGLVDRVGRQRRRTSTRSTTASFAAPFLLRGDEVPPRAASTRCPTGWSRDHFEELGRPPGCCTAASAC